MTTKKSPFRLRTTSPKLRYFTLYETDEKFYLVGCDNAKTTYRFLKIERDPSLNVDQGPVIHEDVGVYSAVQMSKLLQMISASHQGGLRVRVKRAYGLLGFIRFTREYHMILITQRQQVGHIGPSHVFEVRNTMMISLSRDENVYNVTNEDQKRKFASNLLTKYDEQRYKDTFMSMDLTHDFYFSYSYDLSRPLQYNMDHNIDDVPPNEVIMDDDGMFVWNTFLIKPVTDCVRGGDNSEWVLPIIHGYYGQVRLSVMGRMVDIVLIGRRSRYFAGTRFLKRGINDSGHVANHVETEQIVFDNNTLHNCQTEGLFSSFVQIRGSIPTYWSQSIVTKMVNPKPDITLGKVDPMHQSARSHFIQLFNRHGFPVTCLDLVKQKEKKPREKLLGAAYKECVDYLNQFLSKDQQLCYLPWDFRRAIKDKPERALNELAAFAEENLQLTSFFCSKSYAHQAGYSKQSGVLRTNCIDCLDRTNIVQFFIGKYGLGQQLYALGILDSPHLVYHSNVVRSLMELYDSLGDKIALQYGGSRTVSAGINHRGLSWDLMTNIVRYYSNNFKDENKQHAINLFLGNFRPSKNLPKLWDLDSDYHLHDIQRECNKKNEKGDAEQDRVEQFFYEAYDRLELTDMKAITHYLSTVFIGKDIDVESTYDNSTIGTAFKRNDNDISSSSISPDRSVSPVTLVGSPQLSKQVTVDEQTSKSLEINHGQLMREFEDRMSCSQISVLDAMAQRETLLDDAFHNDREYERSITKQCTDYYSAYVEELCAFNCDLSGQQSFLSPTSRKEASTYESYLSKCDSSDSSISIFTNYCQFNEEYNNKEKQRSEKQSYKYYSSYIDQCIPPNSITAVNNEATYGTLSRLKSYYPSVSCEDELRNKILHLLSCMRVDLCVMDRVRHPRPAKKLFNQTSLLELLKGRLYRKCFLSCRAIDWLLNKDRCSDDCNVERKIDTRQGAQEFLQLLLECHMIRHVSFAKLFLDGYYLYKFPSDDPVRVLNMSDRHRDKYSVERDPVLLSMELVEQCSNMYRSILIDNADTNETASITCIPVAKFLTVLAASSKHHIIGRSREYRQLLDLLDELRCCDLSQLAESRWARIAFFINIYHVLLLHGLLLMGSGAKNRIQGMAMHSFYTRTCYNVGGYRFSLSDIRDGILRNNRCFPGSLDRPFIDARDSRANLCIKPQDLRILLLIHRSEAVCRTGEDIRIRLKATHKIPNQTSHVRGGAVNLLPLRRRNPMILPTIYNDDLEQESFLFIPVSATSIQGTLNRMTARYFEENVSTNVSRCMITLPRDLFSLPDFGNEVGDRLNALVNMLQELISSNADDQKRTQLDSLMQLLFRQHDENCIPITIQYSVL